MKAFRNVISVAVLLGLFALSCARTVSASIGSASQPPTEKGRTLTFADRVAYQYAIEEVYWRHRIWPKENRSPKLSLDEVMSPAQVEKKVEDYLRNSQLWEHHWRQPITHEQLQAEMVRMAQNTRQPEMLNELFAALNNDPALIAECLARPILMARLLSDTTTDENKPNSIVGNNAPPVTSIRSALQKDVTYDLPKISSDPCVDNTWKATPSPPEARGLQTAIWTGSEMIVWGGYSSPDGLSDFYWNTGGRYNPATDSWTPTNTINAPDGRDYHTAVWTGSEMIVWGGQSYISIGSSLSTGGRYNPASDTWVGTSIGTGGREHHTAIWTGSEMIVWGGLDGNSNASNTGSRYNPSTNTWTDTSTANAPTGRQYHATVWTGTEMIVWGGDDRSNWLNTGGKYNPATNSWTSISNVNAPDARDGPTAVWTGNEMIVWGGGRNFGQELNTGGKYNPITNTWIATSIANAPHGRADHTAIWTGNEMIVWGGDYYENGSHYLNTGGRYNPGTNSWIATPSVSAPSVRFKHTVIWTGNEMIVWGGFGPGSLDNGAKYNPSTDNWVPVGPANMPSPRSNHTAIWTGSEMIVWGGGDNSGSRYNPSTDSWTATSTANAPARRSSHTAIWTGREIIVWGGYYSSYLNTGGKYNPATDSWIATTTNNAPAGRIGHTGVWTGGEMIVWGGGDGSAVVNTGGRYDPNNDSWTATSTANVPVARTSHSAIWSGSDMIIWGGEYGSFPTNYLNTGARYNPGTNSWTAIDNANAPSARASASAVWTGSEMIVWGGYDNTNSLNTGAKYNPFTNAWTATSEANAPTGRSGNLSVWTGTEMIIWGGGSYSNSGGRYNPGTNSWIGTSSINPPAGRNGHTVIWTGTEMIIWGGVAQFGSNYLSLNSGGRYCGQPSAPTTQNAYSRKTHGSAGTFDVDLPFSGTPGIECRSGHATNDYTIVVTFFANVSVNGNPQAAVTSGIGMIGVGGVSNGGMVTIAGNVVTIPLTGVTNAQTINVTLNSVNGSTNVTIPMSILIGDTNGNASVNASDVSQTKARVGQAVNASNFTSDVNTNGSINASDVSAIKARVGTGLP